MDKFLSASDKTAQLLAGRVGLDGVLSDRDVSGDLCSQYKLGTLLLLTGYTAEAQRLINRIKRDFMQADGDFVSFPEKTGRDRKSGSGPMTQFWSYMNAWIAMAAQRLGRFDISYPAFDFCKTFYNPDQQAVCVSEAFADITDDSTMDCLSTAHFGLLCLYMGDQDKAKACGEALLRFMDAQPAIDDKLLLRMSARTGALITDIPHSTEPFYVVKKDSPNQLYFFLGYHGIFMTKLYQVTQDTRFLDSAKQILDFTLNCHESIVISSFSHAIVYAAALVAVETGAAKYRRLGIGLMEYLMSIQSVGGFFCEQFDAIDTYDQTVEIAIWLREAASELKKII